MFEIPITITNSGALPGTVLSMDLSVTNLKTGATKRFYSAGVGSWSLGKGKGDEVRAFMPLSLAGRDNHSDPVLFYARSDERVMQVVDGVGRYKFEVSPVIAGKSKVAAATFEMDLPFMDHRAFTSGSGTLTLNHPDWRATALVIPFALAR